MDRRSMIFRSVQIMGLGMLSPVIAKAQEIRAAQVREFDRSETLVDTLEIATNKSYEQITGDDLELLTELFLSHIHINSFLSNDFKGLINLKSLTILSIFHNKQGFADSEVFSPMQNLETLKITGNQFKMDLHDEAFSPLESLKVLDLKFSKFMRIPASILTGLPSLEHILVSTSCFSASDLDALKTHFKEKLVLS